MTLTAGELMTEKHSWFGGLTHNLGEGQALTGQGGSGHSPGVCGGLRTRGVLTARGHSVWGGTQSRGGAHGAGGGTDRQRWVLKAWGCSHSGGALKIRVEELCWITGSHLVGILPPPKGVIW